jgi:hypothetical protein
MLLFLLGILGPLLVYVLLSMLTVDPFTENLTARHIYRRYGHDGSPKSAADKRTIPRLVPHHSPSQLEGMAFGSSMFRFIRKLVTLLKQSSSTSWSTFDTCHFLTAFHSRKPLASSGRCTFPFSIQSLYSFLA